MATVTAAAAAAETAVTLLVSDEPPSLPRYVDSLKTLSPVFRFPAQTLALRSVSLRLGRGGSCTASLMSQQVFQCLGVVDLLRTVPAFAKTLEEWLGHK